MNVDSRQRPTIRDIMSVDRVQVYIGIRQNVLLERDLKRREQALALAEQRFLERQSEIDAGFRERERNLAERERLLREREQSCELMRTGLEQRRLELDREWQRLQQQKQEDRTRQLHPQQRQQESTRDTSLRRTLSLKADGSGNKSANSGTDPLVDDTATTSDSSCGEVGQRLEELLQSLSPNRATNTTSFLGEGKLDPPSRHTPVSTLGRGRALDSAARSDSFSSWIAQDSSGMIISPQKPPQNSQQPSSHNLQSNLLQPTFSGAGENGSPRVTAMLVEQRRAWQEIQTGERLDSCWSTTATVKQHSSFIPPATSQQSQSLPPGQQQENRPPIGYSSTTGGGF